MKTPLALPEAMVEAGRTKAAISLAGFYPVISMTDGKIEKIGWLPLGGYRIGIRSPHGGYFYYAHLASYEKYFQTGEAVEAGQILGFMGDTGYGEEGMSGKFPVQVYTLQRHNRFGRI